MPWSPDGNPPIISTLAIRSGRAPAAIQAMVA